MRRDCGCVAPLLDREGLHGDRRVIGPNTTFIVGAGASNAYGLPVASKVCDVAKGLSSKSAVYCLVSAAIGDDAPLNQVLEDLKAHKAASIDRFLEHRQHHSQTVDGKMLIAAILGTSMVNAKSHPNDAPH